MSAFIAMLPAIISAIGGAVQVAQGAKNAGKTAPPYEISESAKRRMKNAEVLAAQRGLPGQAEMEEKIRTSAANAVSAIKKNAQSGSEIIAGLGRVQSRENEAMNQLGIEAAQDYYNRQNIMQEELSRMDEQERQKWQYNQYEPYLVAQQAAKEQKSAGWQSIMNAVNVAAQTKTNEDNWNTYLKMLSGETGTGTGTQTGMTTTLNPKDMPISEAQSIMPKQKDALLASITEKNPINIYNDLFSRTMSGYNQPDKTNVFTGYRPQYSITDKMYQDIINQIKR